MDTVRLGERWVRRLGISTSGLRTTGMWGEPASRTAAIAAVTRAVEMGAEVLEVPLPFGPAADLVRDANVPDAFIVARLTGAVRDLAALVHRLGGRRPDLVLAEADQLDHVRGWGVPLGLIVGPHGQEPLPAGSAPLAAVRGPYPPPPQLLDWCHREGVPYLAPSTEILAAGRLTVALPAPRSVAEVERLLSEEGPTPPAAGPG
ncbi:MAG TPA: hypothetical protein VFH70_05170 [Acidimicrobiales bacterium]|nr:hypothetical protein [Acidimicrobiales bacterium]